MPRDNRYKIKSYKSLNNSKCSRLRIR